MPAVQTCLGLYALSRSHNYILCAHFDTSLRLRQNLQDINRSLENYGIRISSLNVTVFGGDGKLSHLRCSQPSRYIGEEIVQYFKAQGADAAYSPEYYSGFIPRTFNFHYKRKEWITEGQNHRDFMGGSSVAERLARKRIRLSPSEYSVSDARMTDISDFHR
ncbi:MULTISPECIES: hypothetical protein [Enterobacterales]|uniref:hypothetical protein n=1 Tax=Enterobacterales TaxID=91347 RepID=UPI001CB9914F|nr:MULTISPECIES: hypothetical protein [Enterobacterales]